MPRGQHAQQAANFDDSDWWQEAEPPVQPLTREEAQALTARHPSMTVWQILAIQAGCGVLVALIWGAVSRSSSALLSSLYGMAVVVVPSLLMARGVFGRSAVRGVGGLLVWEILKLGLVCAMLALAPAVVRPLDWAALLVTVVLCMKVIGVALLLVQRGRGKES